MAKLFRVNLVNGLPSDSGDAATIDSLFGYDYETVAASQTAQVLGGAGALGDYLHELTVIPASTSPGVVQLTDGGLSAVTLFAGGASSLSSLAPFVIRVHALSVNGAWKVTTGASLSVWATGLFT